MRFSLSHARVMNSYSTNSSINVGAEHKYTGLRHRPASRKELVKPVLGLPSEILLELQAQRHLSRTVAGVFCRLCRCQCAKGSRCADIRCRRSEVRMIQHVGE